MTDRPLSSLFDHVAPIDRDASTVEARMAWPNVPAKCAVYLLTGPDAENTRGDHPYLLATVGNLRAAIQRRLADVPAETHSRRIQYGRVCTALHWRIVHSPFAANGWYWNAARTLFPARYHEMLGFRPTWWIAAEKNGEFPRLRRTQDLEDVSLQYAGPIRDKTAAGKLIETVEDLFDLCRYHHILLQAPHGKPCAYEEMGKCPAPCDGSVPLPWYRQQMNAALAFISGEGRDAWRAATESAMKTAAAALRFEEAGKIKQRLNRAAFIKGEAFSELGPLQDCAWLILQPGKGKPFIEPWLMHPRLQPPVRCLEQFHKRDTPAAAETLLAECRRAMETPVTAPVSSAATEQIGLLAHHLFRGSDDPGIYLRITDVLVGGARQIVDAATKLLTRKSPPKPLPENASDKIQADPPAPTPLPALPSQPSTNSENVPLI